MSIGIDAHVIGMRAGGNESYMRNLLRALLLHDDPAKYLALIHRGHEEEFAREVGGLPTCPIPFRSSYLRVPIALPYLAYRQKLDLLHVQYTAPPWCPCPYVVSMHDIVALRLPETMPLLHRKRLERMTPRTLENAARIFVLTRAIRDDIVKTYGIPVERFDVVQPAPDPIFRRVEDTAVLERVRARYALPGHFVFYVGLLQPRKNLLRLAQAFATLVPKHPHLHLVFAGRKAWLYEDMLQEIRKLGIQDRIHFIDYVAREDLPALFTLADVFAYLSLYEGFGIPVLEALACGTPTLASTDPALLEVAGGAAVHANALDVDEISRKLQELVESEPQREALKLEGPQRAAHFTLQRMAEQAIAGYRAALV